MDIIKLADETGEEVYVNPNKITTFAKAGRGGTKIVFCGNVATPLFVKEEPKELLRILQNCK